MGFFCNNMQHFQQKLHKLSSWCAARINAANLGIHRWLRPSVLLVERDGAVGALFCCWLQPLPPGDNEPELKT